MVGISTRGSFKNAEAFLRRGSRINTVLAPIMDKCGEKGVEALAAATPVRSGLTASSWYYEVKNDGKSFTVEWYNSNENSGVPIAIIIQYGHGTNNGGYVQGIDYVNPAMVPIFEAIAEEAWKEVSK